MATTTQTTITKKATNKSSAGRLRCLQVTERLTVSAACPVQGGTDFRSTLLPNAAELSLFIDQPDDALERYSYRTGSGMILSVLAFRLIFNDYAHA